LSYIGRGTESISNVEVLDNLTFNGSASYTLQKSSVNFVPSSANNLLISISGVVQQGNFSVSGSTITFDTTVSASDTCDWILHYGTGLITTVADGAITEAKLGSNAVTTAKINNGAITSAKLDSGLSLGKIGQVVSNNITTKTLTTSSTHVDVADSETSIVTTSSSSKVLLNISLSCRKEGANTYLAVDLYRKIGGGSYSKIRDFENGFIYTNSTVTQTGRFSTTFLDSPSSADTIYYKMQINSGANSGNAIVNPDTQETSVITLMEVLA